MIYIIIIGQEYLLKKTSSISNSYTPRNEVLNKILPTIEYSRTKFRYTIVLDATMLLPIIPVMITLGSSTGSIFTRKIKIFKFNDL